MVDGLRRAAGVLLPAALLALGACAPTYGPDDTVSLTPVGAEARAARDAALRGPSTTAQVGNPSAAATATSTAAGQPLDVRPGRLGDDATFTGGAVPQLAATPPAASYTEVAPRPVPQRLSGQGPGVVAYALATDHPVGQPVHARNALSTERTVRACARYASDDLAQAAFLNAGGPERDGQGLDPDGDGYACGWDPARFRNAIR
ncbi:hypothetical protein DKT77_12205 [Meridianimarinicoccus roseus]|uniref:Excalibur calcium-binding domain-containing protein n=1 Tax=Meridianimarinicoccus roseus TaxID=2072018 RepID=A0A2V2LA68_9RHOB|nr:hypothetical protein [Meridianimarinicoccus roseus]PWR02308.1 hypothetical protein DKT77_12205 [Meridianimarinicoccus roseus]